MDKEEILNILKSSINKYENLKKNSLDKAIESEKEAEDYAFQIGFPLLCTSVTIGLGFISLNEFINIIKYISANTYNVDKSSYFTFIFCSILLYLNMNKLIGAKKIFYEYCLACESKDNYENKENIAKTAIKFIESLTEEEQSKYFNLKI